MSPQKALALSAIADELDKARSRIQDRDLEIKILRKRLAFRKEYSANAEQGQVD